MTDIEMLKKCVNELGRINVPTVLLEPIGIPVYNVWQNLKALLDSIEAKQQMTSEDRAEIENARGAASEEIPNEK